MQALIVEPPHRFQGRQFQLFGGSPRATLLDHFGLEHGELGLGEDIGLGFAFTSRRLSPAKLDDAFGIPQGDVVRATV